MTLDAKTLIDGLTASFLQEKAVGLDTVVQVRLEGEGGGDWFITIRDGQFTAAPGVSPAPKLTLVMGMEDVDAIVRGTTDPMVVFGRGKVKVTGDMGLAMRLVGLFRR